MVRSAFLLLPLSLGATVIGISEGTFVWAWIARMVFFVFLYFSLISLMSVRSVSRGSVRERRSEPPQAVKLPSRRFHRYDDGHLNTLRGVIRDGSYSQPERTLNIE